MHPLVFLLIVAAAVFGLCFLVDRLLQKLFPRSELQKSKSTVRMPRRCIVIGVMLLFVSFAVLLFFAAGDALLLIGSIVGMLMGALLIVYYFSFCIYYDDEAFLYRDLRHGKTRYTYGQIRGQRSLMTRSGVNATLFVAGDSVMLTSVMQGVSAFLQHAFFRWCAEKGVDPDSIENDPRMLTFFPDPDDAP